MRGQTSFNIKSVLVILPVFLTLAVCLPQEKPVAEDAPKCSSGALYYPDSTDCNAYYKCEEDAEVHMHCTSDRHWNTATNECDLPETAGCKSVANEEETEAEGNEEEAEPEGNEEENEAEGNEEENEAKGNEEDSGESSVSSGDESTSEESVANSDSSSSSSEEGCAGDSNPPECPASDPAYSVFFPNPDPHWFYHCSNGFIYCKQCPATLVWNEKCDVCDWPSKTGCSNTRMLPTLKLIMAKTLEN